MEHKIQCLSTRRGGGAGGEGPEGVVLKVRNLGGGAGILKRCLKVRHCGGGVDLGVE
jgi:hypothetical protein